MFSLSGKSFPAQETEYFTFDTFTHTDCNLHIWCVCVYICKLINCISHFYNFNLILLNYIWNFISLTNSKNHSKAIQACTGVLCTVFILGSVIKFFSDLGCKHWLFSSAVMYRRKYPPFLQETLIL